MILSRLETDDLDNMVLDIETVAQLGTKEMDDVIFFIQSFFKSKYHFLIQFIVYIQEN